MVRVQTIFLMLLFVPLIVKANPDTLEIVEVSSLTQNPLSALPFDRVFYLKIPKFPEYHISSVEIFKVKNGDTVEFSRNEIKRIIGTYGKKNVTIPNDKKKVMGLVKSGRSTKNIIEKDNFVLVKIFPLESKSEYRFNYVLKTYTKAEMQKGIINSLTIPSTSIINKYNTLIKQVKDLIPKDPKYDKKKQDLQNTFFDTIQTYLKAGNLANGIKMLVIYDSLFSGKVSLYIHLQALGEHKLSFESIDIDFVNFLSCYQKLFHELQQCDTCLKNENNLDKFCFNHCVDIIRVSTQRMNDTISDGLLPIDYDFITNIASEYDMEKRKQNLMKTAAYIEGILAIEYIHSNTCTDALEILMEVYEKIGILDKFLKEQLTFVKKIVEYDINGGLVLVNFESQTINGMTTGYTTLKTKGKFSVRPDFGVAATSNILATYRESNAFTTIVPFAGVRLNLKPIDPNFPFAGVMFKSLAHHSSINLSFSLTSMANEQTRYDLFRKTNFILGYGYRINNALNLTGGMVFFLRDNPDPLLANKQLTSLPYIGVTIDFEILDTFKDIINVFK